jgi:hypothetical protein
MAKIERVEMLAAFDEIARAAAAAGVKLEIAVYGGSALMLASNFRYASEDVDVARLDKPWPSWLTETVKGIAKRNHWLDDWFNDVVEFHLSKLADDAADHVEFGTFPRDESIPGLVIYVPTAPYLLALKLKAIRINDPGKGKNEMGDILNLLKVLDIDTIDAAIAVMARYFPVSAAAPEKQRFLLKQIMGLDGGTDAPKYPQRDD